MYNGSQAQSRQTFAQTFKTPFVSQLVSFQIAGQSGPMMVRVMVSIDFVFIKSPVQWFLFFDSLGPAWSPSFRKRWHWSGWPVKILKRY
jgi:hypothetical protein